MKKQKTLQFLPITTNNRNKQTIIEKDYEKNKKGIDPEVNKSFIRKKVEKNISCATQS